MKIKSQSKHAQTPAPLESAAPAEVAPAVVAPPKVAERPTLKRIATAPNVSFMLNPFTGQEFRQAPVELEAIDGWTQSQIDAGKLVEC